MLGRIARRAIVVLLTIVAVVTSYGSGFAANQIIQGHGLISSGQTIPPEMASEFPLYLEAHEIVRQEYYDKSHLEEQEMVYGAIDGMIDSLGDPHTAFVKPSHTEMLESQLEGSFEGIGATVELRDGRFLIVAPLEGSPAAQAGIRPGDVVTKVDDCSVEGRDLLEVIMLIRGPEGSPVRITILREGVEDPIEVEIIRATIDLPVVDSRMLEDSIAYLHPVQFGGRLLDEMKPVMEQLLDQKPRGLILDLRGNPGGYLKVAVGVGSQFIADGAILLEKGKNGAVKEHDAVPGGVATDIPLIVLVDQGSASASEIVTGAVQDHDRGIVIGQQTFGKGSVQVVYDLSDGSSLHITTSHWLTPNGREIEGKGLIPDVLVEPQATDDQETDDLVLRRALEWFATNGSREVSSRAALEFA